MELYESLQAEFCSRIDSSLLAAIISDYAVQDDGTLAVHQVETIRESLNFLANHPDPEEEEASVYSFSNMSPTSPTTPELCDSTTTSSASDSSFSQHSSNSPLSFLREAFSDMSIQQLKLLGDTTEEMLEADIATMVEDILNLEHIRELRERGLDDLELNSPPSPTEDWETVVRTKPKTTPKLSMPTKKKAKGKTIKLVDMMQTHHALPSPTKQKGIPGKDSATDVGVTPWEHILSLSTHLATLLPPASESNFSSYFHSPAYATPADALRAALATLPSTSASIKQSQQDAESHSFFAIIDLLQASPEFATLDVEQRSTLREDARLALAATRNRPDDALSIIWILQDLEHSTSRVGIYHLPPPPSGTNFNTATAARAKLPTGPPPVQPPPTSKRKATSSLSSPTTSTQTLTFSELAWNDVPVRSRTNTHPLEDHIPAYKRNLRAGNGFGKGGKGVGGELLHQHTGGPVGTQHSHFTRRMLQGQKERRELLRKAGQAWRGPGGGAAALFYAQKAREVTERVRGEALEEARALVRARRVSGNDKRTIDLHGTCVQEAIVITKEILENEGCSQASPLCLITGRGTHSVGGVGVLKPAVYRALVSNGWDVRMWDGGLVVQGRAR